MNKDIFKKYAENQILILLAVMALICYPVLFTGCDADPAGINLDEESFDIHDPESGGEGGNGAGLYSIGSIGPAGGWIFYINPSADEDGWTYLEAAPADLDGDFKWSTVLESSGADGTAAGTGYGNTQAIVSQNEYTESAAQACINHHVPHNSMVFDDWFLPSKDELNYMYLNLKAVGSGGFYNKSYWSSSEHSKTTAWSQHFNNGTEEGDTPNPNKELERSVRPVRSF